MGDTGSGSGKQIDLASVEFHTMGMPNIVTCPSQFFCILARATAKLFEAIGYVFVVFCYNFLLYPEWFRNLLQLFRYHSKRLYHDWIHFPRSVMPIV